MELLPLCDGQLKVFVHISGHIVPLPHVSCDGLSSTVRVIQRHDLMSQTKGQTIRLSHLQVLGRGNREQTSQQLSERHTAGAVSIHLMEKFLHLLLDRRKNGSTSSEVKLKGDGNLALTHLGVSACPLPTLEKLFH